MTAAKTKKRSSKGKGWYARYRNEDRREKSKARRLVRHLLRFPGDKIAVKALDALPKAY